MDTKKAAAALGKRGGDARARNLTPEQLSEIGRKGAAVRWPKKPRKPHYRATPRTTKAAS